MTTRFNFANILYAQLRQFPRTNKKYKKASRKMLVKLTPRRSFLAKSLQIRV